MCDVGQDFVVRNDSPCGSTIGPIMSAKLGLATIDIGCAQLSMHSVREMCCASSIQQATSLFQVATSLTHYIHRCNKMLSYRRETELQFVLVLAKSGRLELADNILRIL